MSRAQWTVAGLLLALLGLEVVRSPNVKSFFTGWYANFQSALSGAAAGASPPGGGAPGTSKSSGGALGTGTKVVNGTANNLDPSTFPATLPSSVRNVKGQVP